MEETRKNAIMKEEEDDDERAAEIEILKHAMGFSNLSVMKCAINLGIAEAIEKNGTPMTLTELSSTLKCEPSLLQRIMRFLVHHKIFKEKPTCSHGTGIAYDQTPSSRRLMRHGENSMAAFILYQSSPTVQASWQRLSDHVLANGTSAFEEAHGKDMWSYAASDVSYSKLFKDAMASTARIGVSAIIEDFPEVFDGIETLVDVGGGDGTALRMLVKAFPWIRGINFDLPHVVSCPAEEKCHGVEHVGGDMFENVPKADAIFIKRVLHDWPDDECIKILKNCREAIPKDKGKVIIADAIIEEGEEEDKLKLKSLRLALDITMMAITNRGKERTFKEWDYILEEAGFSRNNFKSIRAVQSLIVAFP